MANRVLQRSEIPSKDKWALEDIYATDEAWKQDLEALKAKIQTIPSYRGRLQESAKTLYQYMQLDETVARLLDSLANYAQRRSDEDTRVAAYQAMVGQITAAWVEAASASSFETPELLAIPDEVLEQFYEDEPRLTLYRRCLLYTSPSPRD